MSAARRKRLERVQKVWEDDLHTRVAALAEVRARADVAHADLEAARTRKRAAIAAKAELMGGASADEWRAREAWIGTCGAREDRAVLTLAAADRAVAEAMGAVMAAQQKIERLKLVLARIAKGEVDAERRVDRINEDEVSARMSRGSA